MNNKIVEYLEERLSEIAREIIINNDRLPENYKQRFLQNPDDVKEHEPNWHQWGIVTHSKKFRELYYSEIKKYLLDWGLYSYIDKYLSQEIDHESKAELIKISMPIHDLGKFRKGIRINDGNITFDFEGHDKISQEIILSQDFREMIKDYGLTDEQIKYVAKCAGNHYELGFLRDTAKKCNTGYTIRFTKSNEFTESVKSLLPRFEGFEPEIGLLFLADSLAKTDIIISAETDMDIDNYTPEAERQIHTRCLNPKLINAIRQRPVNIATSKEYFRIIFK